jgi:hypothetical protein
MNLWLSRSVYSLCPSSGHSIFFFILQNYVMRALSSVEPMVQALIGAVFIDDFD